MCVFHQSFVLLVLCSLCLSQPNANDEQSLDVFNPRVARQVRVLPTILSAPDNITAPVGRNVVLRCQVKDLGPFVVLWNRNRIEIIYAGNYKISRNPRINIINGNLHISNVTLQDSGKYSCQIGSHPPREVTHRLTVVEAVETTTVVRTTEEPTTTTQVSTITTTEPWTTTPTTTVREEKTATITTRPQEITSYEGETVILPCIIEPQDAQAVWKRQDSIIFVGNTQYVPDFRLRISKDVTRGNATLTIRNIRVTDSGRYSCGTLEDENIKVEHRLLVLRFKPVPLEVVNFEEGSHAHLNCKTGKHRDVPTYWRKQGGSISKEAKSNKRLLIFDSISQKDAGDYECLDSNSTLKAFKVNILFKPRISMKRRTLDARRMEVICSVEAKPKANIKWIKTSPAGDSEVVATKLSNGSQELSLLMEMNDPTSYVCAAENTLGSAHHAMDGRRPPAIVEVTGDKIVSEGSDYRLSWTTESLSEIKQFRVRFRRNHFSQQVPVWNEVLVVSKSAKNAPIYSESILLTGLQPGAYSVVVEAENQFGARSNEDPFLFVVGSDNFLTGALMRNLIR